MSRHDLLYSADLDQLKVGAVKLLEDKGHVAKVLNGGGLGVRDLVNGEAEGRVSQGQGVSHHPDPRHFGVLVGSVATAGWCRRRLHCFRHGLHALRGPRRPGGWILKLVRWPKSSFSFLKKSQNNSLEKKKGGKI